MSRLVAMIRAALMRMPILWGGLAAAAFYFYIAPTLEPDSLVRRYFARHPVEYITAVLCFVGMAALIGKAIDLAIQLLAQRVVSLGPPPPQGQDASEVDQLLFRLSRSPGWLVDGYLVRRLREALIYVRRKQAPDELDQHLHYLADQDAERAHTELALVRMIIWAIPILGFLGTVIGITLAIANLSPQALETSLPEVTAGLGVAFDTTALALSLSIVLMFAKFLVDRLESHLLATVDARVAAELTGRFRERRETADPQTAAVREMAQSVLQSVERLAERQTEIWRSTMDATHQDWGRIARQISHSLEAALKGAVSEGLQQHAARLAASEQSLAAEHSRRWEQLSAALHDAARDAAKQQAELARQGELLLRVTESADHVRNLESALNDNISSLAGAERFEQTVLSLSATIQLLNARLSQAGTEQRRVELQSKISNDAAA